MPLVPVDNINPGAPSKICVSCVDKMFDTVYNSRNKMRRSYTGIARFGTLENVSGANQKGSFSPGIRN